MTSIANIEEALNTLLQPHLMSDYCPNGLQVEGYREVKHVVGGVTASMALIEEAVKLNADAILVHHGYFWKNEPVEITGMKYRRIRALMESGIHLLAYHLPLDKHLRFGNNAQLAKRLGWQVDGFIGDSLVMQGRLDQPSSLAGLAGELERELNRKPLCIDVGDRPIQRIAWCTGGAQGYLPIAIETGVDAYISGEISEATTHIARENGVHYIAAGHHATERYGVQAVGEWLKKECGVQFTYVECDNPA